MGEDLWKRQGQSEGWNVDDWRIAPEDLNRADVALAAEIARAGIGRGLPTTPHYYRQYMPARMRGERVILINGFDRTDAEMFPGHGIPTDQWKHDLVTAFGGGCAFWHAAYLVNHNRLLVLSRLGGYDQKIVFNGPK
jgi:hypothetical protein